MPKKYDYLVVGSGLFGSVFARTVAERGRSALVIDKRNHVGGNVYTEEREAIQVHIYGPHIFHTKSKMIWEYVNRFAEFNQYRHKVVAYHDGKLYSLPFNLTTFNQFWGCITPADAKRELEKRRVRIEKPSNLEEFALSQVGEEIYQTLIYGYTKKQWHREPRDLPAAIIRRIPIRFAYDDNYYDEGSYQGIPVQGYTALVQRILMNVEVKLECDLKVLTNWRSLANKLVYSGPIDELFGCRFGPLEYRSLHFEHTVQEGDYQGVAQMNYTSDKVPFTRVVEHRHFTNTSGNKSVVTFEYPANWQPGKEKYYPVNDEKNRGLFEKYMALSKEEPDVIIGGRLGFYKYYDMDQTIAHALTKAEEELAI